MSRANRRSIVIRRVMIALLTTGILVGGAASISSVLGVLKAANPPTPSLFDHGHSALDARQIPSDWTNEQCGSCHTREYEQWKQSRHYVAASNDNFRAQVLNANGGRMQWCMNCHVPINPGAENFPTQEPTWLDQAYESSPVWLVNGIDCLACHVRDGQILVTRESDEAARAHPIRWAPELGTAEFCGGCHQFAFKDAIFPDETHGQFQQASFDEFLDFHRSGAVETRCHDCHMPAGNHVMPGGYSNDMIQEAIDLELSAEWRSELQMVQIDVIVSVGHVGHRVPGGEHFFRLLTLRTVIEDNNGRPIIPEEVSDARQQQLEGDTKLVTHWPQVESIKHPLGKHEMVGGSDFTPTVDSRLNRDESRRIRYHVAINPEKIDAGAQVRCEIWYHVLDEETARLHGFSPKEMRWMVFSKASQITLKGDH